jgi:hypothetical protein
LAFTETWFTERDQDTELAIDGFGAPLHLDRDTATGQLKMHTNPSHSPRWAQRIITVCIYSHFIKKKRKLGMLNCALKTLHFAFSSAFDTIQPHILTNLLLEQFDVSKNLAGGFLTF